MAVVCVESCRAMGLAARFVSGCVHLDGAEPPDLHGWGEVYLHGGGWRGCDPSHGLAVAERHVAVAAVTGSYRGDVGVTLDATVEFTPSA